MSRILRQAEAQLSEAIKERVEMTADSFRRRRQLLGVNERWILSRSDVAAVNMVGLDTFVAMVREASPSNWQINAFRLPVDLSKRIINLDIIFVA